jgi:hypothetical protein
MVYSKGFTDWLKILAALAFRGCYAGFPAGMFWSGILIRQEQLVARRDDTEEKQDVARNGNIAGLEARSTLLQCSALRFART